MEKQAHDVLMNWTKMSISQEPTEDTYTEFESLPGIIFKNLVIKDQNIETDFTTNTINVTFNYDQIGS